jgi:FKBP-type peptidyl-prolyl cis-trans isomerase
MKPYFLSILGIGLIAGTALGADTPPPAALNKFQPPPAQPAEKTDFSKIFKSETEKFNYAVGMSWASQIRMRLKGSDFKLDPEAMTRGFNETLRDTNAITEAQMKEVLTELNVAMRAKMDEKRKEEMEKRKIQGEKNKAEGEAFLAKNKTESGVTALPSGLQYKVITEGSGTAPKLNDLVTVNYKGTLLDGTEFDSSAKAGKPFTTSLHAGPGGVIAGWVEALQLMKTGSKWTLYIPPALAYAENGSGPLIPPSTTLVFEVELLSVQAAPAPPPTPPAPVGNNGAPLTSDIIKVPSAEGLKKGEKIETIKPEDLEKERQKEAEKNGGGGTAPK